ncbi:hypothetical protein K438DRAFT_1975904 [Mycena galopus ATCC 62051]|nr:hypothetical protein K438DRAFT_1975904 [Mycena galopus ATCC 62051]
MCGLPSLSALSVLQCIVAPGERLKGDHCIHMLPEYLPIFDADFSVPARTVHCMPSFSNLHKLIVTRNAPTLSRNLEIFSLFPAVRVVGFSGKDDYMDAPGEQTTRTVFRPA